MRRLLPLIGLVLGGIAQASDEEVTWFNFDSLLVAPIQPLGEEPGLAEDAERISASLQAQLSRSVRVVDISEVPAFETHGYDARTYVTSCPTGEHAGCALVVAQRVEADWAIGGTLRPLEEDLFGLEDERLLDLTFLDVRARRELLSFGVALDAKAPDAVVAQVVAVFDRIIEGAFELVDVRGSIEDPEVQAQIEQARVRLAQESLVQLEQGLGEVRRPPVKRQVQAPRLTVTELQEAHAGRDDLAPWTRVGMDERQYVRFRNSGWTLDIWKSRARGRQGQLLLRGGFGGGAGPFGVRHEGTYLVDFDEELGSFQHRRVAQVQELHRSPTAAFDAEIAFGVHPVLDVGIALTSRSGQASYRFEQESAGTPFNPGPPRGSGIATLQIGPRLTFVPLPVHPVRPMLSVGLSFWRGPGIPPQGEPFERLEAPHAVLLGISPGIEARLTDAVDFFARGTFEQRIAGRLVDTHQTGDGVLSEPPVATGDPGVGVGIVVGVQVRLNLLPERNKPIRPTFEGDDL